MNISKRLYTYPVLSYETSDYVDKVFNVNMSHKMNTVNDIQFDFDFDLTSNTLEQYISDKKAQYMVHVECSETSFRHAYTSNTKRINFEIPLKKINGTVDFVAFVVATKNIKGIKSTEWCEDFEGMEFDIEKGSILAYQNLEKIDVTKDYEDFTDSNSIISIIKKFGDSPTPMEVNLESNRIKISLYEDDYKEYMKKKDHNPELLPILNSMIVFPALVYTFDELRDEDVIQKLSGRNWFISLEKAFEKRNKNFREELLSDENTGLSLAQEVMEMPVGKSLLQINEFLNDSSNQEDEE